MNAFQTTYTPFAYLPGKLYSTTLPIPCLFLLSYSSSLPITCFYLHFYLSNLPFLPYTCILDCQTCRSLLCIPFCQTCRSMLLPAFFPARHTRRFLATTCTPTGLRQALLILYLPEFNFLAIRIQFLYLLSNEYPYTDRPLPLPSFLHT